MKAKFQGVPRVPVKDMLESLREEFDAEDGIVRKPKKPDVVKKPKKKRRRQ